VTEPLPSMFYPCVTLVTRNKTYSSDIIRWLWCFLWYILKIRNGSL